MSDKRLGGIEYSSFRYFSAMRALEVSISRIVKPSFSRKIRRLLPAGSIRVSPWEVLVHHSRETDDSQVDSRNNFPAELLVTNSEHNLPRDWLIQTWISQMRSLP